MSESEKKNRKYLVCVFCNAVENFGDVGFAYRWARNLAEDEEWKVVLWLDDLKALKTIESKAPTLEDMGNEDLEAPFNIVRGVEVRHWNESVSEDFQNALEIWREELFGENDFNLILVATTATDFPLEVPDIAAEMTDDRALCYQLPFICCGPSAVGNHLKSVRGGPEALDQRWYQMSLCPGAGGFLVEKGCDFWRAPPLTREDQLELFKKLEAENKINWRGVGGRARRGEGGVNADNAADDCSIPATSEKNFKNDGVPNMFVFGYYNNKEDENDMAIDDVDDAGRSRQKRKKSQPQLVRLGKMLGNLLPKTRRVEGETTLVRAHLVTKMGGIGKDIMCGDLDARAISDDPGNLPLFELGLVEQIDFDDLLHCFDVLFVRGDDSMNRALISGLPFFWQRYWRADNRHVNEVRHFFSRLYYLWPPDLALAHAIVQLWVNYAFRQPNDCDAEGPAPKYEEAMNIGFGPGFYQEYFEWEEFDYRLRGPGLRCCMEDLFMEDLVMEDLVMKDLDAIDRGDLDAIGMGDVDARYMDLDLIFDEERGVNIDFSEPIIRFIRSFGEDDEENPCRIVHYGLASHAMAHLLVNLDRWKEANREAVSRVLEAVGNGVELWKEDVRERFEIEAP